MTQVSPPPVRLRASVRRIVTRFAAVVCPPGVCSGQLMDGLIDEFELLLGAVPAGVRRSIPVVFVVFDQAARLYPRARGQRFARLGDQIADAYLRAVLAGRASGLATVVQRLKGLVVMCYYELPEVKEQLGYRPGPYIATVSRRRLASYGAEIRAGETAVLAPDGPGTNTGEPAGPRAE